MTIRNRRQGARRREPTNLRLTTSTQSLKWSSPVVRQPAKEIALRQTPAARDVGNKPFLFQTRPAPALLIPGERQDLIARGFRQSGPRANRACSSHRRGALPMGGGTLPMGKGGMRAPAPNPRPGSPKSGIVCTLGRLLGVCLERTSDGTSLIGGTGNALTHWHLASCTLSHPPPLDLKPSWGRLFE